MGINKRIFFYLCLTLFSFPAEANPLLKAEVSFQKGNVFLRTQQYERAIAIYTQAIELQPNFSQAYHKRGTAYYFSKQIRPACHDWKKACEQGHYCMGWNFGLHKKVCGAELKVAGKK